jgi:hypothetical protein
MKKSSLKDLICLEHQEASKISDNSNISYLIYLYSNKVNSTNVLALSLEINLLHLTNIIDLEQLDTCNKLLNSDDKENVYILEQSITTLRNLRLNKYGIYTKDNIHYKHISYEKDILSQEIMTNIHRVYAF